MYRQVTYSLNRNGIVDESPKRVSGKNAVMTFCPKCHTERKPENQRKRELFADLDTGWCHCHNCGERWRLDSDEWLDRQEQTKVPIRGIPHYVPPVPKANARTADNFTQPIADYLTLVRRLSPETLRRAGVTEQVEWMPKEKREVPCIVFNYLEEGRLVNQKFRSLEKDFKMTAGAETIPYNLDSCLDREEVVITEGEFDALAFMEAGVESVVSLPNGASSTNCLNRVFDRCFADKKRIYIATDMDAPGIKAADDLARRFGPEICLRVEFSDGCKDANDELMKNGRDGLLQRFGEAKPIPLPDIVTLSDFESDLDAYYTNGPQPGMTTGWKNLDSVVSFGLGQLALVTGRTNDGKSEWLDELVLRLMLRTGWNAGYWSPENTVLEHSRKVIEKLTGRTFVKQCDIGVQPDQFAVCKRWMKERLSWVELPFDQLHLDTILERCRSLVRKNGIKLLVLDPYNFIEKENNSQRSENAWDSLVVGRIRQFAVQNNVLVFLVAHPRKVEMQVDGRKRRITIEDISGTADFGNKADYCFCIDRDDDHHIVTVSIDKVRRKQYGTKGSQAYYVYEALSGRYHPCQHDENHNPVDTDFSESLVCWLDNPDLFAYNPAGLTN